MRQDTCRSTGSGLLLLAGVLAVGGCVQRMITVTSSPGGALVYLNDEEVGRTPVSVSHLFYGVYDVRLELDDHKPLWTRRTAEAPWWEAPGPDLFAEMVPGLKVAQAWHFDLEPAGEADLEALEARAREMSGTLDDAPAEQPEAHEAADSP